VTLGIVPLWGPRRAVFLMSEVPLYSKALGGFAEHWKGTG